VTPPAPGSGDDEGTGAGPDAAAVGGAEARPAGGGEQLTLAQLTDAVEQLLELHAVLREQVEALAEHPPSSGPVVFRWAQLDAQEAEAAWTALSGWVDWLLDRHLLKEVPRGCWWRHGSIVEELTALWWAWQATYDPAGDPRAPVIWLEQLDRARDRIRLRLTQQGACGPGEHHAVAVAPLTEAELADFGAFVRADLVERPAQPRGGCDGERGARGSASEPARER